MAIFHELSLIRGLYQLESKLNSGNHKLMDLHSLPREQLYDLVWQKPLIALAVEFGVSDVAVKKRCKRLGVPTPGRGYWAKVEAGSPAYKTKLPDSIPAVVRRIKSPESMVYFKVEGADYKLLKSHPFVSATRQALRSARPDERGLVYSHGTNVHVSLSLDSVTRMLWLINNLVRFLEGHAVRMELRDGYNGGLQIAFKDVIIRVYVREAIREFPNPAYNPTMEFRLLDRIPSKIFRCSGRLKIQAKSDNGYGREWADKPTKPLDLCIEQVATEIVAYLAELADANDNRREREKVAAENSRLAWIRQRERDAEEKRLRSLEQLAAQFEMSRQIAQLANEVEKAIKCRGLSPVTLENVDSWLQWARAHSSSLNPVEVITSRLLDDH